MNNILIKVDREELIEFSFKAEAVEYLQNIRDSGRYYCKIYLKEYELETIFLRHLSGICEEIMKSAATMEGVLISIGLGKDGEMTMIQKIVCKLELEGLIEENETIGESIVHRLTRKGLSFYNDYKALSWLRKRGKTKINVTNEIRERIHIYNLKH